MNNIHQQKFIENKKKKEQKSRKHPPYPRINKSRDIIFTYTKNRKLHKVRKKARARSIFVTRIDFEYE